MLRLDPTSAATGATAVEPPSCDMDGRALVERQIARLERLAEIGMAIAEAAGRRAVAGLEGGGAADPAPPDPGPDPGLVFARVSRAVRLTVALQSRLLKELTTARSAEAAARRVRIHRLVERAIEAETADEDEAERLATDAWERLRDEDDLADLATRPIPEAVARICADLGLSEVPSPLEGEDQSPEGRLRGVGATFSVWRPQPPVEPILGQSTPRSSPRKRGPRFERFAAPDG